ncbi:degenerin-like protein asic-2 [Haliotis cracherodii]|uniref:degenerin-like protein asic-2 n=1 Tax=Haliotis cracherodii TaxID=6455 RepID=UPI0039EBA2BB
MITGRRVPTSRLLCDFADNTSAHGVRKLHEKGHWLLKVLWLLLLMTATGAILVQVWQLINLYQRRPVTTKTTINTRSLQFPSVTLCNLNPFKYSNIRSNDFAMAALRDISRSLNVSLEQFGNTSQSDEGDDGGGADYIDGPITSESSFSVNQFLTQISKDFWIDTLLSLGDKTSVRELAQPVLELIVSCTFAGMDCHYSGGEHFLGPDISGLLIRSIRPCDRKYFEACRISCRQHDYIQRLSMTTWPSDHHDMALKAAINANNEKSLGDIDTRKNLVSLNVSFSELTEEILQEEPAYMVGNPLLHPELFCCCSLLSNESYL